MSDEDKNKKDPPDYGSEGSEYLPWVIALAAIGTLLLFVFRRSLIRLFPILFVVAVFIPLIYYCYRRFKYRDVEDVLTPYDELLALFSAQGRTTYKGIVCRTMQNLLTVRDKAEGIKTVLRGTNPIEMRAKIKQFRKDLGHCEPGEKADFLKKEISDQEETLHSLESLKEFLEKFNDGKIRLANHFKNLRIKLMVSQIGGAKTQSMTAAGEAPPDEIESIIQDIETVNHIYESVDKPLSQ